jgi:hypothetical protein
VEEPVHLAVKVTGAVVLAALMLAFAMYLTVLGAEHG